MDPSVGLARTASCATLLHGEALLRSQCSGLPDESADLESLIKVDLLAISTV